MLPDTFEWGAGGKPLLRRRSWREEQPSRFGSDRRRLSSNCWVWTILAIVLQPRPQIQAFVLEPLISGPPPSAALTSPFLSSSTARVTLIEKQVSFGRNTGSERFCLFSKPKTSALESVVVNGETNPVFFNNTAAIDHHHHHDHHHHAVHLSRRQRRLSFLLMSPRHRIMQRVQQFLKITLWILLASAIVKVAKGGALQARLGNHLDTSIIAAFSQWAWSCISNFKWYTLWRYTKPFRRTIKYSLLLYWLVIGPYRIRQRQRRDATSEWSRYAQYPQARSRAVLSLLGLRVLPMYLAARYLPLPQQSRQTLLTVSGNQLCQGLLSIGPLYIKLGQIISSQENRPPVSRAADSSKKPTADSSKPLLPNEWIAALKKLQDEVPAATGARAVDLARRAWSDSATSAIPMEQKHSFQQQRKSEAPGINVHKSFDDVFSSFDSNPIAAASLGQVHRAVLRDTNVTVAVKIQRPFLRKIYDQDFVFLMKIAKKVDQWSNFTASLRNRREGTAYIRGDGQVSWINIFADAKVILYREIDYRVEAANGARFCRDFGIGPGGKPLDQDGSLAQSTSQSRDGESLPSAAAWLRAPYVYTHLSTEKVLVMEYVPSIKSTDKLKLGQANVTEDQKAYLADCLGTSWNSVARTKLFGSPPLTDFSYRPPVARAYLRQFCAHRFFSTDPHPGNVGVEIVPTAVNEKGVRLVCYDFGQAATLNWDQANGILEILEAIVDMDVEKSISSFQTMGVLRPDADLDQVRAKVAENYRTGKVKADRRRLKKRGYKLKSSVVVSNTTATVSDTNSTERSRSLPRSRIRFCKLGCSVDFRN
jgi:predicted unusual protein kinase regulating ubiquinone biosynthesis (AarF/ABC1/UbiB family)